MNLHVLADDGSLHIFPPETATSVINGVLDRYHAWLAQFGAPGRNALRQAQLATNSDNGDKQMTGSADINVLMRGNSGSPGGLARGGMRPPLAAVPPQAQAAQTPAAPSATTSAYQLFRQPVGPVTVTPGLNASPPPIQPVAVTAGPAVKPVDVTPELTRSIGPVPGYPEAGRTAWRSENDPFFRAAADKFNLDNGYLPGDPGYLTPELMKAWAMHESGGIRNESAFERDPFQVNNRGDWAPEKASYAGLTKGQRMDPSTSADAALKWLQFKLGRKAPASQGDVFTGLRRYNGRTDIQPDGNTFSQDYATQIMDLYRQMMNGNR